MLCMRLLSKLATLICMSKQPPHSGNPFANLKQALRRPADQSSTVSEMFVTQKKTHRDDQDSKSVAKEPEEEVDWFAAAMQGITKKEPSMNRVAPERSPIDTTPRSQLKDEEAALATSRMLDDDVNFSELYDDNLSYYQPGVQKGVFMKLRRGQYAIQDELDLHRQTIAEADRSLRTFLQQALLHGKTCVRIVPGKGLHSQKQPVLRGWLVKELRFRSEVLAFTTAPARDGGLGAFYVLLKRAN